MKSSPYVSGDLDSLEREQEKVHAVQLEHYERCSFCHSKLLFSHNLNLQHLEIVESGKCPACGVTTNPKRFTIQ